MTSGIYKIENKRTGQIYIGQSKNIEDRIRNHCTCPLVDLAIAIEGVDNFTFSIIEETDDLYNREEYWINKYNAHEDERHYNQRSGGMNSGNIHNWSIYTLWNVNACNYNKSIFFRNNKNLNPRRCFAASYNGYRMPIGLFNDFLSCEIINQLIKEAVEDEIK